VSPQPTSQDHLARAKDCHHFYLELGGRNAVRPEWAVVALFYSALHYIQAFLIMKGHRPKRHETRSDLLRRQWPAIAAAYEQLYVKSRHARYELVSPTPNELTLCESLLEMVKSEIAAAT
jgi:hypothetical protein